MLNNNQKNWLSKEAKIVGMNLSCILITAAGCAVVSAKAKDTDGNSTDYSFSMSDLAKVITIGSPIMMCALRLPPIRYISFLDHWEGCDRGTRCLENVDGRVTFSNLANFLVSPVSIIMGAAILNVDISVGNAFLVGYSGSLVGVCGAMMTGMVVSLARLCLFMGQDNQEWRSYEAKMLGMNLAIMLVAEVGNPLVYLMGESSAADYSFSIFDMAKAIAIGHSLMVCALRLPPMRYCAFSERVGPDEPERIIGRSNCSGFWNIALSPVSIVIGAAILDLDISAGDVFSFSYGGLLTGVGAIGSTAVVLALFCRYCDFNYQESLDGAPSPVLQFSDPKPGIAQNQLEAKDNSNLEPIADLEIGKIEIEPERRQGARFGSCAIL